jgi:hypothetical protein
MEDTSGSDFAHTWASNDFAKPMQSAFARLERDRIAECIRDAIFR